MANSTGFVLNYGNWRKDTGSKPHWQCNIWHKYTQFSFYISVKFKKLHSAVQESYWEWKMKDLVWGISKIQVASEMVILFPYGYFTLLFSHFSMGCLPSSVYICTVGRIQVTRVILSTLFGLALQPKWYSLNTTLKKNASSIQICEITFTLIRRWRIFLWMYLEWFLQANINVFHPSCRLLGSHNSTKLQFIHTPFARSSC